MVEVIYYPANPSGSDIEDDPERNYVWSVNSTDGQKIVLERAFYPPIGDIYAICDCMTEYTKHYYLKVNNWTVTLKVDLLDILKHNHVLCELFKNEYDRSIRNALLDIETTPIRIISQYHNVSPALKKIFMKNLINDDPKLAGSSSASTPFGIPSLLNIICGYVGDYTNHESYVDHSQFYSSEEIRIARCTQFRPNTYLQHRPDPFDDFYVEDDDVVEWTSATDPCDALQHMADLTEDENKSPLFDPYDAITEREKEEIEEIEKIEVFENLYEIPSWFGSEAIIAI